MNQHQSKQTLSDVIAKKVQAIYVEFADKNTGEVKQAPRFVLRGFKFLKPGATQPDPIYFDGNKTMEIELKKGFNFQTIPQVLYMKARIMKNYCSEMKIYDNAADGDQQLIYHYIAGSFERKDLLDQYLQFKKV